MAANPVHNFCVIGDGQISLSVSDRNGQSTNALIDVSVTNVAPSVNAGEVLNGSEGQELALNNANFTDMGLPGSHRAYVNWGDGSGFIELDLPESGLPEQICGISQNLIASHVYTQQGEYTVTLRVEDDQGAHTDTKTTALITNTAPVITDATFTPEPGQFGSTFVEIYSGQEVTVDLRFEDEGLEDEHSLTVQWQAIEPTNVSLGKLANSNGEAQASANLFTPGSYNLNAIISDNGGGETRTTRSLNVQPLSVVHDFSPSDSNNSVPRANQTEYSLIIYGGNNQLGPYNVNDIVTGSLRLGKNRVAPIRRVFDLALFEVTANVIADYQDFNNDGLLDVRVAFPAAPLMFSEDSRRVIIEGEFDSGAVFRRSIIVNRDQLRAEFAPMIPIVMRLLDDSRAQEPQN